MENIVKTSKFSIIVENFAKFTTSVIISVNFEAAEEDLFNRKQNSLLRAPYRARSLIINS